PRRLLVRRRGGQRVDVLILHQREHLIEEQCACVSGRLLEQETARDDGDDEQRSYRRGPKTRHVVFREKEALRSWARYADCDPARCAARRMAWRSFVRRAATPWCAARGPQRRALGRGSRALHAAVRGADRA